jgi:hypothetical protein
MAPSIQAALGSFFGSVSQVGSELVQAVLSLFTAFLAFGQAIMATALNAGQAVLKLGTDLFQSVAGFVFGECGALVTPAYHSDTTNSELLYSHDYWRWILLVVNALGSTGRQGQAEEEVNLSMFLYICCCSVILCTT